MQIINKVYIKQMITEKSKDRLRHKFEQEEMRLEQECQQLSFEKRKMQHKKKFSKQEVESRFENEIEQRKEQMQLATFKREQLETLEIGSEIVESEVDAFVEVEVGDRWDHVKREKAIVIQDDIVVRIDE